MAMCTRIRTKNMQFQKCLDSREHALCFDTGPFLSASVITYQKSGLYKFKQKTNYSKRQAGVLFMSLAIDLLIICGIIKELTNYQATQFCCTSRNSRKSLYC